MKLRFSYVSIYNSTLRCLIWRS